jgi:hypothetical protein
MKRSFRVSLETGYAKPALDHIQHGQINLHSSRIALFLCHCGRYRAIPVFKPGAVGQAKHIRAIVSLLDMFRIESGRLG